MKHLPTRIAPAATLVLLATLVQPAVARIKVQDHGLFLHEYSAQHIAFSMQGKQFLFEEDSSRTEAGIWLKAGINDHWSLSLALPFMMESQGEFSKSGQGDFAAAVDWHTNLERMPGVNVGVRQLVTIPTGYRKELSGFASWSRERVEWETTFHFGLADKPEEQRNIWLSAYGGFRTDDHAENSAGLWGASLRYHLFKRWVFLESEIGQEVRTGDKASTVQFNAGLGFNLPFGFQLRLGAEERLIYGLDRLGVYGGLSWSRRPAKLLRIRSRFLKPPVLSKLNAKNEVPGFTLEPGTPGLFEESGRVPFLPLTIAVLSVDREGNAFSVALEEELRYAIESDTSFQVVAPEHVKGALAELHLKPGISEDWVSQLGRRLNADYVLTKQIVDYSPWKWSTWRIPWLVSRKRAESSLAGRLSLHEVEGSAPPFMADLSHVTAGEHSLHWFQLNPLIVGSPDAVERNHLNEELLRGWSEVAREQLFYETSEQVVIP